MLKAQEKQSRFNMNLQLFSNSQPSQADLTAQAMAILQGGGQPQAAAPMEQPQSMENNPQNSPQMMENGGQVPSQEGQTPNQTPQGTEQPGQQAPSNADVMMLGKFKSPEELANAYTNLEKFNTQTRQELAQAKQAAEAAQAAVEQMRQQMNNVVNPQAQQPQPTPEEQNEMMMNKFYENPSQFFNDIKEQAKQELMQQIAPIQQQYQQQQQAQAYNQALSEFAQQVPDFQRFQPVMSEILANNPELNGHPGGPKAALNIAYQMAKGQQYQDPNSLLQNQDFVKQNILGNQDIKNQIIQEYLQSLKQGNQAPTVISGQANGQIPMMPETKPQNMQEAKMMAMKLMQG
jgi:hypothetical protein